MHRVDCGKHNNFTAMPFSSHLQPNRNLSKEAFLSYGSYTLLSFALLTICLWFTEGQFTFSLDDPYIHLALAENLLSGHYGINSTEYSAPSSSILWPLLIAPISALQQADIALLFFNAVLGIGSLWLFRQLLNLLKPDAASTNWLLKWSLVFILMANLMGLSFVGMEHQLQVLFSLAIFLGLYIHLTQGVIHRWLWAAIILAPLIRYESLAISASALFYLFFAANKTRPFLAGIVILGLLTAFSAFLLHLGLSYLPDSILVKSSPTAEGLSKLIDNLKSNFIFPKSTALLLVLMLFLHTAWFKSIGAKNRLFFLSLSIAIALHLLLGRTGWLFRYEIYIWVYAGCGLFVLFQKPRLPNEKPLWKKLTNAIMVFYLIIGTLEHMIALAVTPVTSSNIYHQQVQMSRFVKAHYRAPVAVNDLGLVSVKNPEYVLDLWGLGSSEARKLRQAGGTEWLNQLIEKHQVKLIMIYNTKEWISEVPDNWIKLGELQNEGYRVVSYHNVSFYTPDPGAIQPIINAIHAFSKDLPGRASFQFEPLTGQ